MSQPSSSIRLRFAELHDPGSPLVLVTVWDAGSATAVTAAGAMAVGTGSWAVAASEGMADGEQVPFERVLERAAGIVAVVGVPVTVDIERGYGATAPDVAESVRRVASVGVAGVNVEDSLPDGSIRSADDAAARVEACRSVSPDLWVNARTDVFFTVPAAEHAGLVGAALARATRYAEAGADSVFVPGLTDPGLIAAFCRASPLPVNVMATTAADVDAVRALGPARISMGPGPYLAATAALTDLARAALGHR